MRLFKPTFWIFVALLILGIPAASHAQVAVGVSVHVGPPVLPVYEQPPLPAPGYIWTPGYWAYGPGGYYWVPGTWVEPPGVGLLWTPGYWGWAGGVYVWHGGYWGPHVGYYGGINYGYGYTGVGFAGGYWRGREYYYNRSVANFGTTVVHNTYNTTIVNNTTVNRTAYNGGPGGVAAKPTSAELAAGRESHVQPTAMQTQHQSAASTNRAMLASTNHGQPTVAATSKPGVFRGAGVVAAGPGGQAAGPGAGQAKGSANGAANRNAATVDSPANARAGTQTTANPNAAKTTGPGGQAGQVRTQPTYGARTSQATPGAQPSNQPHGTPGAQPQLQQHQGQPQQHQPRPQEHQQQRQAEPQQENKPHKP